MTWQILVVISIISISIGNLYQRIAMRSEESDAVAGAIIFQFILTLITGIFAFTQGFVLPSTKQLPLFLLSGVLYAIGTLSYFKAIKLIEASESTILASIGSIVTILTAYIFLGEHLSNRQLLGTLLILTSVVIISWARKFTYNRGVLFSVFGTVSYGLAVTNDVYILRTFDAISYVPMISIIPGIILLSIFPRSIKYVFSTLQSQRIKPLFAYCLFYSIQAITYYMAVEKGAYASQMALLYKSEIFLTVILAALFLHEYDQLPRKLLATVIATTGVMLLV